MRRILLVGLLIVVVALLGFAGVKVDDGSSGGEADAERGSSSAGEGTVVIEGFAFAPGELTVAAGIAVTWTNQDGVPHAIQDDSGGELFAESEELGQGESFAFTYDQAGEYAYICGLHNYMQGTVTVTP